MSRVYEAMRRAAALAGETAEPLTQRATFSILHPEWLPTKGGDADRGLPFEAEPPQVGPGQRNDERGQGWPEVQELLDKPWVAEPVPSRGDVSADLTALDRVLTATPAPRRRGASAAGRNRT
jgi:hypothetical protein